MNSFVILVDKNDNAIGIEEKIKAHQDALLHRAFSIFIFDKEGKLLIQQRGLSKYHSAGLWSNTCCSHPRPEEDILASAHRRLNEEMGFDCELSEIFSFKYKTEFDNTLTENEYDHVFVGYYDSKLTPNSSEVNAYKFVDIKWLEDDLQKHPNIYTIWLKICFQKVLDYIKKDNAKF